MSENVKFMDMLVSEKFYYDLDEKCLFVFTKLNQTVDMFDNLLSYDEDIQMNYLLNIKGFADKEAAIKFLNLIESNENLLQSKNIYDHNYENLLDSGLKSRYTRKHGILFRENHPF